MQPAHIKGDTWSNHYSFKSTYFQTPLSSHCWVVSPFEDLASAAFVYSMAVVGKSRLGEISRAHWRKARRRLGAGVGLLVTYVSNEARGPCARPGYPRQVRVGFRSGHRSRVCAACTLLSRDWSQEPHPSGDPGSHPFLRGPSDTPPSSRAAAPRGARARAAPRSRPRGGALSGARRRGALGAGRGSGRPGQQDPDEWLPNPGPHISSPEEGRERGRRHSNGQLSPDPAAPSSGRFGDAPSARGATELGPPSGDGGPRRVLSPCGPGPSLAGRALPSALSSGLPSGTPDAPTATPPTPQARVKSARRSSPGVPFLPGVPRACHDCDF